MIQALIINNNGSAEDAKDIFQEALMVLYERVRSGSFELSCQIKTYLYSVSKRLWLKKLGLNRRFKTQEKIEESTYPIENDLEIGQKRDAEFEMMEKALSQLGEPCQSLLEAYYLQKLTMQEIASSYGYTNTDSAKNQKYKCLVRLKKIFFTYYNNEMDNE